MQDFSRARVGPEMQKPADLSKGGLDVRLR